MAKKLKALAESATDSTGWTGANAATIELMHDIGYVGEDE